MNSTAILERPAKRNKRRRGKGGTGPIVDCESVASARLIDQFLKSLTPKERGYALRLLLKTVQKQQSDTEGGGI